MSAESIQFLQALHRGADPDALFQGVLQEAAQGLGDELQGTADGLIQRQKGVQEQVKPVVEHAVALDVVKPEQQQLEACQKRIADLQRIRKEMDESLAKKKEELDQRNQKISGLVGDMAAMRGVLSHLPPSSTEAAVIEFGQRAVNNIAGREQRSLNRGGMGRR